jgi:L,D-transpeptidase catalytic domain
VKEQKGRRVKVASLQQRIAQALTVPGVERTVRAPVRILKPKVTQAQLADKYPVVLVADRYNFKLRLYKHLQLQKEYIVAVGALGFDTPAGLYHIQNKAVDPAWHVPNSAWPVRSCRAARRRTRSRSAGLGSTTAPESTAPTRPTRSAQPPRTAASGCRSPM